MASVVVSRGSRNGSISIDEATRQFDLLFDEYFDIGQPATDRSYAKSTGPHFGENVLECGEEDEVYIDSASDPDQKELICKIAKELAAIGDQYGGDLQNAENVLTILFTDQAKQLEYQTFEGALESLMGHNNDIAGFVCMLHVSKSVYSHVGNVAMKAKTFFRRYIGENYSSAIAESGGVGQFVKQQ